METTDGAAAVDDTSGKPLSSAAQAPPTAPPTNSKPEKRKKVSVTYIRYAYILSVELHCLCPEVCIRSDFYIQSNISFPELVEI